VTVQFDMPQIATLLVAIVAVATAIGIAGANLL
jgi:hypothetical protein